MTQIRKYLILVGLLRKTDYNTKITKIESKICNIPFSVVENEISNVSDLVKKANYDTKISDILSKYFTASN